MIGYINLDCREVVEPLNEYYDVMIIYLMHFVAVKRMLGKEKIFSKYHIVLKNEMAKRLKKVYDIQRQYGNKRD